MTPTPSRAGRLPLIIAAILLAVVALAFAAAFIVASEPLGTLMSVEPVSAYAYRARVDALLANADPTRAEALLNSYACVGCHRGGAANAAAPSFVGIAARAATRRPPLSADAYLYESIIHPEAYGVPGYTQLMPRNFGERMSDAELGDIIAYLLTADAD